MKLVVNELVTYLEQQLTTERLTNVYAVRPHLYKHFAPAGTLKMQIRDMSDNLIAESDELTITDIDTNYYFHGYVRFYVSALLAANTTYKFRLVPTGYTFSESAYVGWCNDYDLSKYELDYTANNSLERPLDCEVWAKVREF